MVDNLDYGILNLLRQNARAGYGDIGERVGLSASAVKRRVIRVTSLIESSRTLQRTPPFAPP